MHWADVIAEDLLKEKNKKHVLATGITPSGPIHIGNMREVLTADAIYRALLDTGVDADLIYIADDFDHLRKVYPFLPIEYNKYIGMSISEIPCPCGKHKSYADHYLSFFIDSLKKLGIKPIVYHASSMYQSDMYFESIQTALENKDKIKKILQEISKRKLPRSWLPFKIKCEKCKRITSTTPKLYEFPNIEYSCGCGFEGGVDIRKGGVGKLPWRVDWPARWKILGVTFEPFGKDLGTVGGARQTGEKIVEEIYNYPAPKYTVYEFLILKGRGAMHSSKGTALSSEEMLKMTPPEVLRFLIMKNQPNKHIVFDPGLGILNLVDEYDQVESVYFDTDTKIKGMKDLDRIYELSQPKEIPNKKPVQIPYRHLVTLIQIGKNWDNIKEILMRTGQISKDFSKKEEDHLKKRIDNVIYWLESFAPDSVCFKVNDKVPEVKLNNDQKRFLNAFIKFSKNIKWIPEDIHKSIYEISTNQEIAIQTSFSAIYQIILNQERGPRAGFFLSNLDKDFVLKRFKEAVK